VTAVRDDLTAFAAAKVVFHAGRVTPGLLLAYAIEYAINGWPVFPLRGKAPAIPNPHPRGSVERRECHGECGQHGHGLYDATLDLGAVCQWWGVDHVGANIGIRPPAGVFVLDNDPKTLGHTRAAGLLLAEHGPPPVTLTHRTGRGNGGRHRFYRRPPGKLTSKLLGPGFDIKDASGYVVAPPSIHPDTGWRYVEEVRADVGDPGWLTDLIVAAPTVRPAPPRAAPSRFARPARFGASIADTFTDSTSWLEILGPHGWTCLDTDPDADGAVWLHPAATSECSATVTHGCLFVWSTSTVFEPSTAGDPHGYTRFRAYAELSHDGDMKAAARSFKEKGRP
jgi:Bifunctional DNA primase/polymerase, N-terminal